MGFLVINIDCINSNVEKMKEVSTGAAISRGYVNQVNSKLDSNIKSRRDIGYGLNCVESKLELLEKKANKLFNFIDFSMNTYDQAEKHILKYAVELGILDGSSLNCMEYKLQVIDKKDYSSDFDKVPNNTGAIVVDGTKIRASENDTESHKINTGAFSFDLESFKTKSSIWGLSYGLFEAGKRILVGANQGFGIMIKNGYVIIKGARKSYALSQGIKGTRYAIKNINNYPNIAQLIKPWSSVKAAFKGKAGLLNAFGIFLDVVDDTYKNIELQKKGLIDSAKISTDILSDVIVGAGGIALSAAATGAVTGALAGSVIPVPIVGTVVGAATGVVVGVLYTVATETIKIDGKSLKDHVKEGVYEFYNGIMNWSKKISQPQKPAFNAT